MENILIASSDKPILGSTKKKAPWRVIPLRISIILALLITTLAGLTFIRPAHAASSSSDSNELKRYTNADTSTHWVTTGTASSGFQYEHTLGYLLQNQDNNTQALYGCFFTGTQDHFLSLQSDCEGQSKDSDVGQPFELGYAFLTQPSGVATVGLYRCTTKHDDGTSDHFVSTDDNCEGQQKEQDLGYAPTASVSSYTCDDGVVIDGSIANSFITGSQAAGEISSSEATQILQSGASGVCGYMDPYIEEDTQAQQSYGTAASNLTEVSDKRPNFYIALVIHRELNGFALPTMAISVFSDDAALQDQLITRCRIGVIAGFLGTVAGKGMDNAANLGKGGTFRDALAKAFVGCIAGSASALIGKHPIISYLYIITYGDGHDNVQVLYQCPPVSGDFQCTLGLGAI